MNDLARREFITVTSGPMAGSSSEQHWGIQIAAPFNPERKGPAITLIPDPESGPRCNYIRISPDGKWLYACFVHDIRCRQISPELTQEAHTEEQ